MAETTDPRTVPAPAAAPVAESPRIRVPSPELDQLRNECAALGSIRQAVINLCAGRPDTHLMNVGELRAAIVAPPAAGVPLPVTWSGDVVGPTGGGPRARTLLPLVTSYGTPATLALDDGERSRLVGKLGATLHPAETCTTPRCGETEPELDVYMDEDAHRMTGWIAVRVSGAGGPIRWWCSPACATSAITAGGADIAAADRTAATDPEHGCHEGAPLAADAAFAAALPQMMRTAARLLVDQSAPCDLDEQYGLGAYDEYVNQLGEAADERGDVDEAGAVTAHGDAS